MCATSAIIDQWTNPHQPNYQPWNQFQPPPATAEQMLKVIELLEKIDKKMGLRECKVERKAKAKFKAKLRRRSGRNTEAKHD
jgi:hypothetical protein